MSQASVSAIIDEIYAARDGYDNSVGKTLSIGGTNVAPDARAMSQISMLKATYGWTITHTAP